jgi:hypothetical protein
MKSIKAAKMRSNPWPMLIWLLIGPVPLFLVLAYQSHQLQAKKTATPGSSPSVLMVSTPVKPVDPSQPEPGSAAKKPEIIKNSEPAPAPKSARR